MKWQKKGLIYAPSGELWWAQDYAHLPTVDVIEDEFIRVYFASLDQNRYGRVGYVDLDIDEPKRILHIAQEPVLDIGELGTFDDSGVNPSCVVDIENKKYMYYIGWQRCERIPYMLFAGLAISKDGGKCFQKVSRTPVLDRTDREPFLRSATTMLHQDGLFRAWYVSALEWIIINDSLYPKYVIRYADSKDGLQWKEYDHICINFENEEEFGFGRPWVTKEYGIYRMWYSIRTKPSDASSQVNYNIGYAESTDGINWTRKDGDVGISPSEHGWDSEMICYPCVVDIKGERYMFYNGNQHGASGFGYAVLEE